jgi:hypothetical protein
MSQAAVATAYSKEQEQSLRIAGEMLHAGLPPRFVQRALEMAFEYEGAFDLMALWAEEPSPEERANIIADLDEQITDLRDHELNEGGTPKPKVRPKINFDDIPDIGKNIVAFKKRLRAIVDSNGGVVLLSEKTGMSEPSLYRFFSSASIPRKTTLYKIANALDLEEKDIALEYTK